MNLRAVRLLLQKYLKEEGKYGSMKPHFIRQYLIEFMCTYGGWDEFAIDEFNFKN